MGVDLLVAGLWAGVLAYWLWTRRPAADTVGMFHRELRVLERATPARVSPANRLAGPPTAPTQSSEVAPPRQVAPATLNKRSELRRRRRDILAVLASAAVLTLLAALASGSSVALAFQVCSDLALAAYVYLLSNASRAKALPSYASRSAPYRPHPPTYRAAVPARRSERRPVPASVAASPAVYGDFDSYAKLA